MPDPRKQQTKNLSGESKTCSKSRQHYRKTPRRAWNSPTAPGRYLGRQQLLSSSSAQTPFTAYTSLCHWQSALAKTKVNTKISHFWSTLKTDNLRAHQFFTAGLGAHTGTFNAARSHSSFPHVTTPTIDDIFVPLSHVNHTLLRRVRSVLINFQVNCTVQSLHSIFSLNFVKLYL